MLSKLIEKIDRAALLNKTVGKRGYSLERDIAFGHNPRLRLDHYKPAQAITDAPLAVFIHGGTWEEGSKDDYLFVGEAFAARGYHLLVPNYRLYPEVTFPEFVEDGATALAWITKQEDFKGHKVVLIGHSAGGLNAALLAMDKTYLERAGVDRMSTIAGFIGLAGGYDFLPLEEDVYGRFFPFETRDQSQAINYVDDRHPPTLLLYGAKDRTVHPHNAVSLNKSLLETRNLCEFKIYPNLGHIGILSAFARIFRWRAPVLEDCLSFIKKLR